VRQRIDGDAAEIVLEVQVRPGRQTGIPGKRDDVALFDFGARLDCGGNFREMRVRGLESGMLDADVIAEAGDQAGDLHFPVRGGPHERANRRPEVDSRMQSQNVKDGIACRKAM